MNPPLWRNEYPFESNWLRLDSLRYHYIDTGVHSSVVGQIGGGVGAVAAGTLMTENGSTKTGSAETTSGLPNSSAREDDSKTILCVHGNPTWSFYFRKIATQLRDAHRVVAVDHVGCGLSDKPQRYPYTLETHTRNLVRFVESRDLRDIVMVVHDWGGAIGLGAALQIQDRLAGLVITNTGAFPPPYIPLRISLCRFPFLGNWAMRYLNAFAVAATRMAISRLDKLSVIARSGLLAPYDSPKNRVAIAGFVKDIPMRDSHPTHAVLTKLEEDLPRLDSVPTSIVWGMKDWCFRPDCLEKFQRLLPSAKTLQLADVGHYVMEEAADEVIAEIESLIKNRVSTRRQE